MKGLKLACVYAWRCSKTQLLNIDDMLLDFILDPGPKEAEISRIRAVLEKLDFFPTCDMLSDLLYRPVLNEAVVKTYWFGSRDTIIRQKSRLCHNFEVLKEIKEKMAENSFSQEAVQLLLGCLVSSGRVFESENNSLKILSRGLVFGENGFRFGEREVKIERGFVGDVGKDDLVSVHLGIAREKIDSTEEGILRDVTTTAAILLDKIKIYAKIKK